MPELPEVETIKRGLLKYLIGHKISDINVRKAKIFSGEPKNASGAKIINIRRFAKVLSIDLSNHYSILIHVKMTGQLVYRGPKLPQKINLSKNIPGLVDKHTHVIFKLDQGGFLYFIDLRQFGWVKVIKTDDVLTTKFIAKLGPEPFKDLDFPKFKKIISKYKTPIKQILMDQEKIAGIGNIYANDALYLAKIHPRRAANSLQTREGKALYQAILEVLKNGIKYGGASDQSFVRADGTDGQYQKHFLIYGKQGTVCTRCKKEKITKFKLGGRGTYYCPFCQTIRI